MSYNVWFQCNQGKYYITHDDFWGLGDLTNYKEDASLYKEPVERKEIEKFLCNNQFNVTILAWGNEEVNEGVFG